MKGYVIEEGYMGYVNGTYMLFAIIFLIGE